jgi:hypothetical protein
MPRENVVAALKDADLFWFGSEIECFPLVILEAMAAGTPWLSMDVGNVAELAGGWIAKPHEMAAKAQVLLASDELRRELGKQGQDEWKARFTWKHIVDEYEQVYLTLRSERSNEQGLVSVIIPCYKQAHYLAEAVESVIQQSYRNFEIIIASLLDIEVRRFA